MDDLKEKKKRLEKAISFLISIGEIGSDTPTKNVATRMNRDYAGVCSAINGAERYLTRKFTQAFCAEFGGIISFEWLWEGKGEMTTEQKYKADVIAWEDTSLRGETQKDRLKVLKDWLVENDETCRHSETRVLKVMGLGDEYFNTPSKRGWESLHSSIYVRIKRAWPYVNLDWIMTGKGDMITKSALKAGNGNGVPYFDVDFMGGFDEMINDQTSVPAYFVDFKPFNEKGNMWLNITGDSMAPRINSGDKICIRQIDPEDVIYGEIYAIVTHGGLRTVKWLTRSPLDGMVRLVPENKDPRFGDYQDIDWKDIMFIYRVIGAVRSF